MTLTHFHNLHAGETCLIVGNGPNLKLTPPERFTFPSFGMNRIYSYSHAGWMPTYYTAVDSLIMREDGAAIAEKYRDIPKFVPSPNLDKWQGENFYRFYHRPGRLWVPEQGAIWNEDALTNGITYSCVTHIAMQLAYFMGFTTMLIIGMQHRPGRGAEHFYGNDESCPNWPIIENWFEGYKELRQEMGKHGVEMWNISEDTYVSEDILPRRDWRDYASEI